ncbi:AraC family transcriptional regulator [Sulfitobacter sp. M57]|uniref:helix-turn-helix domain-containing protein n=1 Tax=unclassified Sulfitobacter TaxID=196795 RepID=UPI0023E27C72|nr:MULTISPECIES: AraC family transcriptional regulator [unclassified Sulfitobacter]MDF3463545.1 AraC family transcriptional regulator [Sulfitobacter sp. Ks18]MDF3510202.1 AraC family transcriptional regulator [Sulfitobacter sp. M57]MDF3514101.1 AraC family transcriptional regulator [Sulfitobacter sp. M36]MDF3521894.1 AraC family transcriptional regulator [Sulfitobacter sp. M74]MDF3415460.1 AraC family transcriptional regulator [Sulfitobacter sp. KE5]
MPVLPIPVIIALLLTGLLVHRVTTRSTHPTLLVLIGCCAAQSAMIALVQYYDISGLKRFQPLLPTLIPAVAWLAFRQSSLGRLRRQDLYLHMAGPAFALICFVYSPQLLDLLIPLLFAGYGTAIAVTLLRGEDSMPHSRLENGRITLLVWRVLAAALLLSASVDVFIELRRAAGDTTILLWLPSLFSSITLFVLGALGLSHAIETQSADNDTPLTYSPQDKERDTAIITKLETYMQTNKPYLDPDLTLVRLARKMQVPEKQLSSAINKGKGENVSRYINRQRILFACNALKDGKSVTEAMLASGFNTKSNFNREFLRVMGVNPRHWLQSASKQVLAEQPDQTSKA